MDDKLEKGTYHKYFTINLSCWLRLPAVVLPLCVCGAFGAFTISTFSMKRNPIYKKNIRNSFPDFIYLITIFVSSSFIYATCYSRSQDIRCSYIHFTMYAPSVYFVVHSMKRFFFLFSEHFNTSCFAVCLEDQRQYQEIW